MDEKEKVRKELSIKIILDETDILYICLMLIYLFDVEFLMDV